MKIMSAFRTGSFLTIAVLLLGACVAMPGPQANRVPPGKLFKGDYLDVRAPASEGWHLMGSNAKGMIFARNGANPGESFIAQVSMFSLPATKSKDDFVALVRKAMGRDDGTDRFNVVELRVTYSDERAYPCARAIYIAEDRQATVAPGRREKLLLQVISLYCRHPVRQDTGFSIGYSFRGRERYSNLEKEATEFMNGVRVPGH